MLVLLPLNRFHILSFSCQPLVGIECKRGGDRSGRLLLEVMPFKKIKAIGHSTNTNTNYQVFDPETEDLFAEISDERKRRSDGMIFSGAHRDLR